MRLKCAAVCVLGSMVLCAGTAASLTACSKNSKAHQTSKAPPVALKKVAPVQSPAVSDIKPADFKGLHNVVAYHEGYYSGSVPEGEEGFETLQGMGIRTIISVDGAEPDVRIAREHGMRYIHLPIGYNGFDEERKLELARATRDAKKDGPVYIHCHHGKHRSAGAAGAVIATLGWATPAEAVGRMKVSGTNPGYTGLYACAAESVAVSAMALDAVPADFPEVSPAPTFVKGMVEMDHVWDHLAAIEKAGWVTPKDHPDLVPVAEAGRLVDLFRSAHASDVSNSKPADFREMLKKDEERAQALEDMLAADSGATPAKLSAQFRLITASCKECHVKHRDKAPW